MTTIPVSAFRYIADGSQAVQETQRVRGALEGLNEISLEDVLAEFNDLDLSLEGLAKKAVGLVSAGAIVGLIQSGIDLALELGTAAQRAGTTAESLSKLKFAADESDVSFEALTKGIRQFQDNISAANAGQGDFARSLNEIGLQLSDLKGLALEDQLAKIAGGFAELAEQTDQVRISNELLGPSSKELILLLQQGEEGFRDLTKRAEEAGVVLDNRATAAIDRNVKSLERLKNILVTGAANIFGGLVADTLGSGDEILEKQAEIERLEQAIRTTVRTTPEAREKRILELRGEVAIAKRELEALKQAKEGPKDPFAAFNNTKVDLPVPELLPIDDGSDALREAERRKREEQRLDERIADDMIRARQELEEEFKKSQIDAAEEVSDRVEEELQRRSDMEDNIRNAQRAKAQRFEEDLLAFRRAGSQAATVLLTAYGGKFQAVGKAILIFEKIMAIKSTFINTREAVMKTLAKYGATYVGLALAAGVAVLGAAQIAAIAAQGTEGGGGGGASGVGGLGGGALGIGSAGSQSPADAGNGLGSGGASGGVQAGTVFQPAVAQVIIQGDVFSSQETAEWFIEEIRKAVNERDVVIVNAGTAQASEIMRT